MSLDTNSLSAGPDLPQPVRNVPGHVSQRRFRPSRRGSLGLGLGLPTESPSAPHGLRPGVALPWKRYGSVMEALALPRAGTGGKDDRRFPCKTGTSGKWREFGRGVCTQEVAGSSPAGSINTVSRNQKTVSFGRGLTLRGPSQIRITATFLVAATAASVLLAAALHAGPQYARRPRATGSLRVVSDGRCKKRSCKRRSEEHASSHLPVRTWFALETGAANTAPGADNTARPHERLATRL